MLFKLLVISDAPVIASTIPVTRKVNVIAPKMVYLKVNFYANPSPQTTPSWRFVDVYGVNQSLPLNAVSDYYFLTFILSSESKYGSYTYQVSNTYGVAETTFQVLPPGRYTAFCIILFYRLLICK